MTEYTIEPDTDITSQWELVGAATHHDAIIDSNDASFLRAGDDDEGDIDEWGMDTEVIALNITKATVHYRWANMGDYGASINFYDGVAWKGAHTIGDQTGAARWLSHEWAGLNMTQAMVNACKVRITAGTGYAKNVNDVCYEIYVVLWHVSGEPAGIAEVYGMLSNTIAQKYGTNWSEIAEIYGIT